MGIVMNGKYESKGSIQATFFVIIRPICLKNMLPSCRAAQIE